MMNRLKIATVVILLVASAAAVQAKIAINGPAQFGAATDQVVGILSVEIGDIADPSRK
jgi:hypothetical protein